MRYAVYALPAAEHPLTRAGQAWIARDAIAARDLPLPKVSFLAEEALAALLAEPRRYGFHATLKAPFRLAAGLAETDLRAAFAAFCRTRPAAQMDGLAVGDLGGFIALLCAGDGSAVDALAAETVTAFDRFRAPPSAGELARRRPERLSPRERAHLDSWGYPWVLDAFRFHMTLTGRIADGALRARLIGHLDDVLGHAARDLRRIDHLALFRQADAESPFLVLDHLPLRG